jgi:hypothetical protein
MHETRLTSEYAFVSSEHGDSPHAQPQITKIQTHHRPHLSEEVIHVGRVISSEKSGEEQKISGTKLV